VTRAGPGRTTSPDRVESVIRDVLDGELGAYEREVTIVVAAVVGGGLMLLSAFSVAGVALLAPDPLVVIGVLLALGALLLLAGLGRIGTGVGRVNRHRRR